MKIAVTGASGLIGGALVRGLRTDGHEVLRLVRGGATAADEVHWNPQGPPGEIDAARLEGLDAVVHLAGAGIGDKRWSEAYKKEVYDSRVTGTRTLAEALAGLTARPRVLVSGSAIGYYGDTGDREADEDSPQGTDFLSVLVHDWEAAAQPARDAGIRVVHPRTGLVLDPAGGVLKPLLPLFRLGLGGRLGSGRQWMSWISLTDHVAALRFLIEAELDGPVNLTAPAPVTNAAFTRALGQALRRPAVLAVPAFVLRRALGEFADEGPLISQRVLPRRLERAGFGFGHPFLDTALTDLVR